MDKEDRNRIFESAKSAFAHADKQFEAADEMFDTMDDIMATAKKKKATVTVLGGAVKVRFTGRSYFKFFLMRAFEALWRGETTVCYRRVESEEK